MTPVNPETGELVNLDRAAAERRAERIRLRLDSIADNYAAVMPMIREAIEKRDDLALGYRSVGEYVADRFGGALTRLGVEVRREVVRELTEAGLSTRAIAPVVGVDNATVHRDLRSGVAPATPALSAPKAGADQTPQGEATDAPEAADRGDTAPRVPRPAVTGLDGKTYTRPAPQSATVEQAVTEFPDLAYYAKTGRADDAVQMADDLRRYRERGELDARLSTLRRSIDIDQSKRDGTYVAPTLPKVCHACGQTLRSQP